MTPSREPKDVFASARLHLLNMLSGSSKDEDTDKHLHCIRADLGTRDRLGRATYGTPLLSGNGRDWLVDVYEELLDALVYAEQGIPQSDAARNIRENVITALLECAAEFGDRDMDSGYLANRPKNKAPSKEAQSWTEYVTKGGQKWMYATGDEE